MESIQYLEREGWIKEGEDHGGVYLSKRVSGRSGEAEIVIRCKVSPVPDRPYCLVSFSVRPMGPRMADEVSKHFGGRVVWYYVKEEARVFFWSRSPEATGFPDIGSLEDCVLSAIFSSIKRSRLNHLVFDILEDYLVREGWICIRHKNLLRCRKTIDIRNKMIVSELSVKPALVTKYGVVLSLKVYVLSEDEASRFLNVSKKVFKGEVEILERHPRMVIRVGCRDVDASKVIKYVKLLLTGINDFVGGIGP